MQEGIADAPATETADQYKARLDASIVDKEPIAMQREAPRTRACLIEGAPDEMLSRRPAPGCLATIESARHRVPVEISAGISAETGL